MKILHITDTHLGFSAYRKVTEDGVNQREQDIYDAFSRIIDYALKIKPDVVLHAGDLFDMVRPNNRAITFALHQILRLSQKKIPFVVIAGNHEQPRLKETGHIFSIFDHINHVYSVYHSKLEIHRFTKHNKTIAIHALPHCSIKLDFEKTVSQLKPDETMDYNILLTHGSVSGIKELSMNEFNELMIPEKTFTLGFDYYALGHYHKHTKLHPNAYYAGSPERFTFTEAGEQKGFNEINFSKGKKPTIIFKPTQTRPMIEPMPIHCTKLKFDDIMKNIIQTIDSIEPNEKIYRIHLKNIPSSLYRALDFHLIQEHSKGAIHYEIKADIKHDDRTTPFTSSKIGAIIQEFKTYLKTEEIEKKTAIEKLGIQYLEKSQTKHEGT